MANEFADTDPFDTSSPATDQKSGIHSSSDRKMDATGDDITEDTEEKYHNVSEMEVARRASQATVKDSVKELHPYAQTLGINDLESCLALENATFPEAHRGTREKYEYRLTKSGQLCLGLFTSAEPGAAAHDAATSAFANPPDSSAPERRGVLLAHIIATLTTNELVKDEDMEIPNWKSTSQADTSLGHKEDGRTLAVHSFAVLPNYQRRGLGTTLLKAYVQRMVEGEVADRISILTYDHLVPYYQRMGFDYKGKADVKHGGEDWNDMMLDFEHVRPRRIEEKP